MVPIQYNPSLNQMVQSVFVRVIISPNNMSGTFKLQYGGVSTASLTYNCSADNLQNELVRLSTLHDSHLDTGDITVGRIGPDLQGGYQWFIAMSMDSEQPWVITSTTVRDHNDVMQIGSLVRVKRNGKFCRFYLVFVIAEWT